MMVVMTMVKVNLHLGLKILRMENGVKLTALNSWIYCKPFCREKIYGVLRVPMDRQVGQHFAEDARELEAVSGKAASQCDLRVIRMMRDDKIFIGRHRVHAGRGMKQAPVQSWKILGKLFADFRDVAFLNISVDGFGSADIAAGMHRSFYSFACPIDRRKAIEHFAEGRLPDVNRKMPGGKTLDIIGRLKPCHHMPTDV